MKILFMKSTRKSVYCCFNIYNIVEIREEFRKKSEKYSIKKFAFHTVNFEGYKMYVIKNK